LRGRPDRDTGERRQLSVLFCDLVGSTSLSRRLDPEELRELVEAYHETCARIVEALGGWIAQYLGDGILVYFGFPTVHEHDALRAVTAGLRIQTAMPETSDLLARSTPALADLQLRARIGIHTGPVVVGPLLAGPRSDPTALGDTPNLAARLVAQAEPGTVLVSDTTRRLAGAALGFEDAGFRQLAGFEQPIRCWRALDRPQRSETETRMTPLAGREDEVQRLRELWAEILTGRPGRVVLIDGEAGIGKTRLVRLLRDAIRDDPHVFVEGRGSPLHAHTPFHPIIAALEQRLALESEMSQAERVTRLRDFADESGLPIEETLAALGPLLGLASPSDPAAGASAETRRRRMLDAFVGWLARTASRAPVLLVVEDLHWIDPSTLELLGLWIELADSASVLVVATYRPGFVPPWGERSRVEHMALRPLQDADARGIVSWIAAASWRRPMTETPRPAHDAYPARCTIP
jgi:class 3 adenylate cyclase